ncbi:MAG: hypothetical protein QOG15_3484 [Solirubrobacteraceae bacterium]|jgi:hypothetical protein|nr:hypothetical protein [Solirubrobacteraceae bacterium]
MSAPRPTRPLPHVGMDVEIVRLGASRPAVVEEVRDEGRTLIVAGEAYTLSRLTAHYVRAGDPYYGVRLRLRLYSTG